jgi:SAM-dependent methyltransferase
VTGTDAPGEVAPDDWETHWDDYADSAGRNPAQTFRRRVVLGLMGRAGAPQRYLDVGCGQGDLAADVAKRWPGAEVAGLELSAKGCELASGKVPGGRFVQFDLLSGQDPPEALAGWATHATCSEVLEHVDEPGEFLMAARRWLAPGATLVVTVPGGPMSAFDHHIGHRRHYDIPDLTALLEGAGFTVGECGGGGFPLFNLYRRTVIARGERLVSEVKADGSTSLPVRAGLAVFSGLLAVSPTGGRRGWQLDATATAAAAPASASEEG